MKTVNAMTVNPCPDHEALLVGSVFVDMLKVTSSRCIRSFNGLDITTQQRLIDDFVPVAGYTIAKQLVSGLRQHGYLFGTSCPDRWDTFRRSQVPAMIDQFLARRVQPGTSRAVYARLLKDLTSCVQSGVYDAQAQVFSEFNCGYA